MRKATKKVFAEMMAAAMVLGMAGNVAAEEAPLRLSIMLPNNTEYKRGDMEELDKFQDDINAYTNTDVEWVFYADDMYYERLTLMYTTGELPDILVVGKNAEFFNACENDFFWDLTDYIDDYPNLATIPEATRANASFNGKMYGIPRSRTLARNGVGYRLDWLNNLGLKEPTTLDEFYDMLYAFTYDDPDGNGQNDTYGFVLSSYTGPWDIMQLWFGVPNQWGIDENGDLIPSHMTEEYDEALKWFRQIYSEGLVNPDFRDLPTDEWDVLLRTGVGGASADVLDRFRRNQDYFDKEEIAAETNLVGAMDAGYGIRCMPTTGMNNMIAISKANIKTEEELKRALQFLNDLNDAEMLDLIERGYEGITYKMEDGHYVLYTEEEKIALGVPTADFRKGYNQVLPYFSTPEETAKRIPGAPLEGLRILENELYQENIQYCVPNYGASYTSPTYVSDGAVLDDIMAQGRLDYITGVIDEVGLQAVKEQWLKSGGQAVIDEMNELYHASLEEETEAE